MLRVEVICVGSELLMGKINTHVATIGSRLFDIGLSVATESTVGDDPAEMRSVFASAWKRSDIVVCAGGLGPTFDDETREVWSSVLHRPLIKDHTLVSDIQGKFQRRGLAMPSANVRQAYVLKGAQVLNNPFGTAPGQRIQIGKKVLFLLPGPFRELSPMLSESVIPFLQKMNSGVILLQKTFLVFGVPESEVDRRVRPIVERVRRTTSRSVVFAILASQGVVSVKFVVRGRDVTHVMSLKEKLSRRIRAVLSTDQFGEDQDTLVSVVSTMLRQRKNTLAVAESCTGGLLSDMITAQEGASQFFLEGMVTYSNSSKQSRLGVPPRLIQRHGAVSAPVVRTMAESVRRQAHSDFGVAITGIAGPASDGTHKPVGLVFIGVASGKRTRVESCQFFGDRTQIRQRASLTALNLLRQEISR